MITYEDAGLADEFHISHAGLPCSIWTRDGVTHYGPGEGQFRVGVISYNDITGQRMFCGITTVNAGDFHTITGCPNIRSDRSDNPPVPGPVLRTEDGYDIRGFDADGYDENGHDENGYDRNGYDDDGYNREGFDAYGYNSDGYDDDGYDENGFDSDGDHKDGPVCDSCDERRGSRTETGHGSDVCDGCLSNYYTWCDDCEGYYPDEEDHDHDNEDGDSCCESPQLGFQVRNDGCEPLANDTRFTVTLPAGSISAEGLGAISSYLLNQGNYNTDGDWVRPYYGLSYDLEALGDRWQAKTGNYTRRLSRHAYQEHHVKLPPDVLSQVGCIARDHSKSVSTAIEVTRDLNLPRSDFYHDSSCWWTDYRSSRCALKTNGGFGLRSFSSYGSVSGRAWVLPLRLNGHGRLGRPTFETMTPDAFVVFNGYGDLASYTAPRILAHMAGWTYRKIDFSCSPMYVNAGGYLVAPEEIAEQYTDGSLSMSVDQHSGLYESERELVNA